MSADPYSNSAPVLVVGDALQWIRRLHRHTGGFVQVCSASTVNGGRDDWDGNVVNLKDGAAHDKLALYLQRRDTAGATGLYVRQTSMSRIPDSGRGTVADTLALPGLWLDGDTDSPAHKHVACDGGEACQHPQDPVRPYGTDGFKRKHARRVLPLPADAATVWAIVAEAGYKLPTQMQDTGNGVYGHWMLDEPRICTPSKTGPEAALSDRFHQQLKAAAARLDLHYGPLADLPRVLRLPGSVNRKPGTPGGARPSVLTEGGSDRGFTWAELEEMVELAEARTTAAEGVRTVYTPSGQGKDDAVRTADATGGRHTATGAARPKLEQDNSPIDDFNRRADWLRDILAPAGWREAARIGAEVRVTRPGKEVADGHSATINATGVDTLHVFSSDAAPFEADTNYTKAGAWRELHHGGGHGDPEWVATNRDLRRMGYGDPLPPRSAPGQKNAGGGDATGSADNPDTARPALLPTLPEEFWAAREYLTQIREFAHSWGVSADVVFTSALARLSGMVPYTCRVRTGIKNRRGASLNLFVAVYDGSGAGKSSSVSISSDLIELHEPDGEFVDGVSIGSGQGIPELFIEEVEVEISAPPQELGPNERPRRGKTEKRRVQTKHNAYIYVDEGGALTALMTQQGSVLGATLRTAAMGGTLGQANATKDRYRHVPEGSYSLGMVVGFQPSTVDGLLSEHEVVAGTPQRFLWVSAADPNIPELADEVDNLIRWDPTALRGGMGLAPSIKTRLRAESVARGRGELVVDTLDAHKPIMLVKLAGLLAILDKRTEVEESDWALAETVWANSVAVRTAIQEESRDTLRKRAQEKTASRTAQEVSVQRALREDADDTLQRVAKVIARCVHKAGADGLTRGYARRSLNSRDHPRFAEGLALAAEADWVVLDGQRITPGDSMPVD